MKIIVFENKYIVGFAESIDKFIELNNNKTYPYKYDKDKLTSLTITPDVFAIASISGGTNFADYPRLADKE